MTLPLVYMVAVTVAFVLLTVMLWWLARRRDDVMPDLWLEIQRQREREEEQRMRDTEYR